MSFDKHYKHFEMQIGGKLEFIIIRVLYFHVMITNIILFTVNQLKNNIQGIVFYMFYHRLNSI